MQDAVQPFDLVRMFLGDQEALFYLEILVRTIFIYAYALLMLRWLGSRAIGQLSTVEFLLVIALGSAVGDPMFQPDVPLFHAMAVITIVVFANKGLDILIAHFKGAGRFLDGCPAEVIRNGMIMEPYREGSILSVGEIFQKLRVHGISHLGQVRQAFIEPSGTLSIFESKEDFSPGLPIVPPWEIKAPDMVKAGSIFDQAHDLACMRCGTVDTAEANMAVTKCPVCDHAEWTLASRERLK